jgi:hypothetical protein
LYILKNHTFLLLGPFPFELWCKSYLSITVESLHFLQFAFGFSFVYLSPPLLCFSARTAADALAGHVRHTRRRSAALPRPRALPCSTAAFPNTALATPALSTSHLPPARAALHHRSPSQRLQRHLLLSAIPHVPSLPRRRSPDPVLARPCVLHVALPPFEPQRAATRIAGAPAPAWARPHPLLDPEHFL